MSGRIEIAEIQSLLPHRYPFLLLDAAEDYVPGGSLTGIKAVTVNEPYFQGHFPGNPLMPGVLMVEALGQTGAVLMFKSLGAEPGALSVVLLGADRARFRAPVRPGCLLRMPVVITGSRLGVYKFKGEVHVDGAKVAEAEFSAKAIESS